MNFVNKKYLINCILCLIIICLFGGTTLLASELEPIKIGTVFPRSGPLAFLGNHAWIGCEIARQIVNENGGVNGREVIFVDADAPDSQAAASEAERLIAQHGVEVIIGSYSSGNSLAISAVTERNRKVLWENQGISDEITSRGFKYLFRYADVGGMRGKLAIDFIAQVISPMLNIPVNEIRVAAATEDSSYGESQAQGLLKRAKELGVNVVTHERYANTSIDLSSMILRLMDSKPDVVFSVSYVNDAILFWNQAQQYGADFKVFIGGGGGWIDPEFGKAQGKAADGLFVVDAPTNLSLDMYKNDETREIARKYHEIYKNMTGEDIVPLCTDESMGGTYAFLTEVLPKAGPSYDADTIAEVARTIDIEESVGTGWPVRFDETGQNMGDLAVVNQWENGATKIIWPPKYAVKEINNIPLPVFQK